MLPHARRATIGELKPVLLVGGFGVPTATLAPLAQWLRSREWDVHIAASGWNVGCGEEAAARVEGLIQQTALQRGPVSLVGHSRGGLLGRVAAVRAGDKVATLVTVCTPWTVGPPDKPGVGLVAGALRFARRHGYRGFGSIDCATGACCERFRIDMDRKPAANWTLLWSHADRVTGDDWQTTGADATVDIGTSHLGAVLSERGRTAVANALG